MPPGTWDFNQSFTYTNSLQKTSVRLRPSLNIWNGWYLLGAAVLTGKVVVWICSVFTNIRKVIMRIIDVVKGLWRVLNLICL